MSTYSVHVRNESASAWKFYVYQSPPEDTSNLTLAWFASKYKIGPGYKDSFEWNINYQFVWSASGEVRPGIKFEATGQTECDPDAGNTSKFTFLGDTPLLSDAIPGGEIGHLFIHDGPNVPSNTFAVGVGMSGNGTFVVNAGPNLKQVFSYTNLLYCCHR